ARPLRPHQPLSPRGARQTGAPTPRRNRLPPQACDGRTGTQREGPAPRCPPGIPRGTAHLSGNRQVGTVSLISHAPKVLQRRTNHDHSSVFGRNLVGGNPVGSGHSLLDGPGPEKGLPAPRGAGGLLPPAREVPRRLRRLSLAAQVRGWFAGEDRA